MSNKKGFEDLALAQVSHTQSARTRLAPEGKGNRDGDLMCSQPNYRNLLTPIDIYMIKTIKNPKKIKFTN